MKTRFTNWIQSPDICEGTLNNSNYSTERSPTTALLFEAKRTVVLPLVRLEIDSPVPEILSEAGRAVACSVQEH
jgi:hypothetical protein